MKCKCVYCGRRIWWFQERAPDDGGYIHSDGSSNKFCCKWDKIADATRRREEAEKNGKRKK